MGFEDVSKEVEWEARRIASAFGVESFQAYEYESERQHPGVGPSSIHFKSYRGEVLITWTLDRPCAILLTLCVDYDVEFCLLTRDDVDQSQFVGLSYARPNLRQGMARGLYRLGIEDEKVLAELRSPLTAHEKLELRLSLPREFWPKTWLDEENQ